MDANFAVHVAWFVAIGTLVVIGGFAAVAVLLRRNPGDQFLKDRREWGEHPGAVNMRGKGR